MAEVADIGNTKEPRRCGRQTQRNNVPTDNEKENCRRAVFLPFLDFMNKNHIRFGKHAVSVLRTLTSIPSNIYQTSDDTIGNIVGYIEVVVP